LPNIKSAAKAMRISGRRRLRNKSVRSATRTYVTRAVKLISGSQPDAAQEAVTRAVRALDTAAQKGVIHANAAARSKSRLVKKLNAALSSAQ